VHFTHPVLPDAIQYLEMKNLRTGEASVDLAIRHKARGVGVNVLRREGSINIAVTEELRK